MGWDGLQCGIQFTLRLLSNLSALAGDTYLSYVLLHKAVQDNIFVVGRGAIALVEFHRYVFT